MTETERFLICVLSSHVSGAAPTIPDGVDYAALSSLAHAHKLTPILYSVLTKHCKDSVPEEYIAGLKRSALMQMTQQVSKSRAILDLSSEFNAKGIKFAVVKGITLRALYPEPDLRISSDEDVLVCASDFGRAADHLLSSGFEERKKPDEETNVRAFSDAGSGLLIELHNSLFPHTNAFNENMAALFDGALDRSEETVIDNCKIPALSPTDSLLYLILHSFKHFVYCGFGLRQVSDFIVYAKANINSTDAEYIVSSLEKVKASGFFKALLDITEKHFGCDRADLGFAACEREPMDTDDLLEDIISGGAYGNSTPERIHSSLMTIASAGEGKKSSALSAVFPPYSVMKERYRFVAKHKILLPAGWCARILSRIFSKSENFSASETVEIGRRRVGMLKKYGVIE